MGSHTYAAIAAATVLLFLSAPVRADVNDIDTDATATGICPLAGGKSAPCTSFTFAMTVGTGSNRMMIAGAAVNGHNVTPTVTWTVGATTQTLTSIGHIQNGSGDTDGVTMYALLSPTSGSGTVTVSITGGGQKMAAGAVSFINVSQTIPTAATASGNSVTPTITVNTGDRHVVTDVMSNTTGSTAVGALGTAQTLLYTTDTNNGRGGGGETGVAASGKPGCLTGGTSACPSTTTMSWTLTATDKWEILACDLTPATSVALLAVTLRDFSADRCGATTTLKWRTAFEARNVGFMTYRDVNGVRTRITPSLLAGSVLSARSGNLAAGRSYAFSDTTRAGAAYWLEEIDTSGAHRMHGPAVPRERCPAITTSSPLPVNSSGVRLRRFDVAAPVTRHRAVAPPSTAAQTQRQWTLAASSAVKIAVQRSGMYRVTGAELIAAGLDVAVDPRNLQLFVDGVEQAMKVTGFDDGRLDASDTIEFYGTGMDTYWTDSRVYWLVDGKAPGKRMAVADARTTPDTSGGSFRMRATHVDRTTYYAALTAGNGENFFGSAVAGDPVDETITIRHIDPASTDATLEVALQGLTAAPHIAAVSLNGTPVGTITFSGLVHQTTQFPIAPSLLREGENVVTLSSLNGTNDISAVDSVSVDYSSTFSADNDVADVTVSSRASISIGGFSTPDVRVFDISDPANPRELLATIQPASSVSVGLDVGSHRLYAITGAQIRHPLSIAANQPSMLHAADNRAGLMVIAHHSLVGSLAPLKAAHEAQGMSVFIADLDDVYDEFSFGEKDPAAVKRFLTAARSWQQAPRYVLLAGDASFDPRNYLGMGDFDLVPSHFISTREIETMSDDWFVDFDNDGFPDLPIGRFPVRTPQEAAVVVAKTAAYLQRAPGSASRQALVVADRNDGSFDFEQEAQRLAAQLPSSLTTTVDRLGSGLSKSQFLSQMNAGNAVVGFIGHGSVEEWSGEELLTSDDALALANGSRTPFVFGLTCLNGFFADVYTTSIAESLLNAPNGGAVAVWASSSLTTPDSEAAMGETFLSRLFTTPSPTIGDAILGTKSMTTDADARSSFILFGDPALRLN